MKKIFVKPQVSTQPLKGESLLQSSVAVKTNASAVSGGVALSKNGHILHQQDILLDI